MMKISVESVNYLEAPFRSPFKFGAATIRELIIPEVRLRVTTRTASAVGIGAMPHGNAWSFPGVPYEKSLAAMRDMSDRLAAFLLDTACGNDEESILQVSIDLQSQANEIARRVSTDHFGTPDAVPALCRAVVFSPFDIALFDAWGRLHGANSWDLLRAGPEGNDLSRWLGCDFARCGLQSVLSPEPAPRLAIYHVVGGVDALSAAEVERPTGDGLPDDLASWIARDGLTHFKIKLRGSDPEWDFQRIAAIDRLCSELVPRRNGSRPVYSLDLNEQCPSGDVLRDLLLRLRSEVPAALDRVSFVEQPTTRDFTGEREAGLVEASAIKPVVVDEGLTDMPALERALRQGYSGVCLKACKGIGFSLLAAAVAERRNLDLCVQDLTCPGVSFLASASLAARVGVDALEANARQFCPQANATAAERRPEVFELHEGAVATDRFRGEGLGYD